MKMGDYLRANHGEYMPSWLTNVESEAADVLSLCRKFLSSRLVFYPGSGSDGDPIAVFNRSRAAHCFVHVDYGMTRDTLEYELKTGFRGYDSLLRVELREADLVSDWVRHIPPADSCPPFRPVSAYGFIEIYERRAEFDDTHGAERFAVLFLGADGYAAFDSLFCQENEVPAPFCIVLQDHGFGGGYGSFGRGGMLEKLAIMSHARPCLLLVGQGTEPWKDYRRCDAEPVNMGEHRQPRYLFAWSETAAANPES